MKEPEIRLLAEQLPPDCPYFRQAFRHNPAKLRNSTLATRQAAALNDVALGWNLASSYAEAGLDTPPFITQTAVVRANCKLLYPDCKDAAVTNAEVFNTPEFKPRRNLLQALLCCPGTSVQDIAGQCHIDPDVLSLFEQLFWNVRDRLEEKLYINQLLYKNTRFPGPGVRDQEQADPGLRLCRLGYEKGITAVLHAAGVLRLEDGQGDTRRLYEDLEQKLLLQASLGVAQGLVSPAGNPCLPSAMKLQLAKMRQKPEEELDEDARRGLAGMSLSMAVTESFMRLVKPDLDRRLALQRDMEIQRENEQKAASEKQAEDQDKNENNTPGH